MYYKELIDILQETYKIQIKTICDSPAIMDIRLLDSSEYHWNENVLYIGSLLEIKTPPDRPIMLLSVDEPLPLLEGSNHAHICPEDLSSISRVAKDLILEDLRGDGLYFELAQLALTEKNIKTIINSAARLLGNALILVDSSQKVLAHSTLYEIVDPLWAQNIEMGFCSYEFVQKVRSNNHMKEWSKHGRATQLITLPGDLQPKLVARITQQNNVVGALIMVEHHSRIQRFHYRLLPLIGRLILDIFNRDLVSEGAQGSLFGATLYNLLDEAEISNPQEYITMTKLKFPEKMFVIVARYVHNIDNRYLKRTLNMELERIFPKGHSVKYKNYNGILVPSISEEQREELSKLAQNEDISIGLSWPFNNILEFKRHFNQAVASIKQAQRFGQINQVFDYCDYNFYDMLYNYTGKMILEHYTHPALKVLRKYDKANSTELFNTLRVFLENKNNLRSTAEALFVHRNTLIYRMNRIQQLTSLDLNRVGVVYSLMDSFRIDFFIQS
ncbi:MAG TPA: hypothetical protein DEF42_20400 [Desulfosporosinus sp.]|nr:hypothetical protein [Desulfosporosinus sp.]